MARTQRGRRGAVAVVLLIASLAMVATTPGQPTARADAEGDVSVGPDQPARISVRHDIPAELSTEIESIRLRFFIDGSWDSRFALTTRATVGDESIAGSHGSIEIAPRHCRAGCTLEAFADLAWVGPREDAVRLAWEAELEVVYENRVPEGMVTAVITTGHAPPIPRVGWFALGALLAAISAAAWVVAGNRLRRARLLLAATIVIPAAWVVIGVVASLLPGSTIVLGGLEDIAYGIGSLVLCVAVITGVIRAWRGRPSVLRIAGWLGVAVIGFLTWLLVMALPTYRPHEVVLLTLALGMPVGAAVTAQGLGSPVAAGRRSIAASTATVAAAQLILVTLLAGVCAYLVVGVVAALVSQSGFGVDVSSLLIGLAPFAVLALHIVGMRAWWKGERVVLILANIPEALVVVAGGIWSLAQREDAFLSVSFEFKVFAAVGIIVVLVATIGAGVAPPPRLAMPPPAPPPDSLPPDAPPSAGRLRETPPPA